MKVFNFLNSGQRQHQKNSSKLTVKGITYDEEHVQYCIELEFTLKRLESFLHTSDNPEEIAARTLKTACEFYGGDWSGILEVDLDLDIWTPVWWYNSGPHDRTKELIYEFEAAEFMPSWIKAMGENEAVIIPDTSVVKDIRPDEYGVYQRLRAKSVIAAPFKPNPMGFLVVRNPTRYTDSDQTSMLNNLAYVLHRAMSQQKALEGSKMKMAPENIERDTDVVIHLLGNLEVYTSRGVMREADFKSPLFCKMLTYMALNPKLLVSPIKLTSVLWPESDEDPESLAENIKHLLYRFRQSYRLISDHQLVQTVSGKYRLNPELNIMTDIQLFDRYRDSANETNSISHKVEFLKKAVAIYDGHVFDSNNSEDWVMPTATHYALSYIGVVNELLKMLADLKDYPDVIKYSAQALQVEPGNMRAHYWRIYALYRSGASEMAQASLPMAQRSLTEEEYDELLKLLRVMEKNYPPDKPYYGDFLP